MRRPSLLPVCGAFCLSLLVACSRPTNSGGRAASIDVLDFFRAPRSGDFVRVTGPRPLRFPEDHAAHPDHQIEWWYFTGNLGTESGRRFGYQLTFFRLGYLAAPLPRTSAWASSSTWMAHFAITDADRGKLVAPDRFARGGAGLAGAVSPPFRVWLEDWEAQSLRPPECLPLRLRARTGEFAIDLELDSEKPLVLQGDQGFSPKGAAPRQACHYLSYTRMDTQGRLKVGGEEFTVSGLSWMDHEWSTGGLAPDLAGWDWFSIQLEDGRDLMLYQLRSASAEKSSYSEGTMVDRRGGSKRLSARDVSLQSLREWRSPRSGVSYPVEWEVLVPSADLQLRVRPLIPDQELDLSVRYWEGAIVVESSSGRPLGRGYVELVGYRR